MNLSNSNTWVIVSLIISVLVGPIVVWEFQQGKIEKLRLDSESELLELEKGRQTINLYEKLADLMENQRQLYDQYSELNKGKEDEIFFERQRVLAKMSEHDERIVEVKNMISSLTGKNIENIKGKLPPLPPKKPRVELMQMMPKPAE